MNRLDIVKIGVTAFGLVLAFPPFTTGLIAFLVLVPLFSIIEFKPFRTVLAAGFVTGLIWGAGTFYWIGWATVLGVTGTVLAFALYWMLFTGLLQLLVRKWGRRAFWTAPLLWTGYEMLIGSGPLAFPWNSLAYTQSYSSAAIQFISHTGSYGLTFWIVLVNVLLYFLSRQPVRTKAFRALAATAVLIFILPWLYGWRTLHSETLASRPIRISLIQGNIDPYKKWTPAFVDSNFTLYQDLTRRAGQADPDLIVWPETAAPSYLRRQIQYLRPVKRLVDSLNTPILTGSLDYHWIDAKNVKTYNAAFLVRPTGWHLDKYYKMRLVPFSERVPLMETVPFLYEFSKKFTLDVGSFTAGDSVHVFSIPSKSLDRDMHFGTLICYDSVFPQLGRDFVRRGAEFLVIITNDGWFGPTSGPYQHARIAVFRAIENRVWIARCANTGISECIDPFGRIVNKTRLDETAVLTESIGLPQKQTFYVRHGQTYPAVVWSTCGLVLAAGILPFRRRRPVRTD